MLLTIAAITNAASATQFSSSAIVKRCSGGIWKKLKAAALSDRGEQPEPQSPHSRDQQDRRQVDDPERDDRRHLLERVDEERSRLATAANVATSPSQREGGSVPNPIENLASMHRRQGMT